MKSQVVAGGVRFAEGPVWCGNDTLVVTSVADGALYLIDVPTGGTEILAETGGGANGAALAADGSILVTQNGGVDFSRLGLFAMPPPFRPATPGLQHAQCNGSVTYLADRGFCCVSVDLTWVRVARPRRTLAMISSACLCHTKGLG